MNNPDYPIENLPIVIIGAGPVGLAAAAHLKQRGLNFLVVEAGDRPGFTISDWSHVRLFSPWRYLIDRASRGILEKENWTAPALEELPTGGEYLTQYLIPLAVSKALSPFIQFNSKVSAIGRIGFDKVKTENRDQQPFELILTSGERIRARAVIDASGTWLQPNPIGSGGLTAIGENKFSDYIEHGIPDVLGEARKTYADVTTMVVGSGHSAMNALLDLLTLAKEHPKTKLIWSLRKAPDAKVYGGEDSDALPARGLLGKKVREAAESGRLSILAPFRLLEISKHQKRIRIEGNLYEAHHDVIADRIIASTGFRPNISMLREIRVDLDPWLEAPTRLAPMIDPNLHSCGTVRPHGVQELRHPEKDFYIAGMKSYGRAPTFLMATGYEQVRSIAAMLDGDVEAASRVELDLPETGVCNDSGDFADLEPTESDGCCGGPPPENVDACCVIDADAKAVGEEGCGCNSANEEVSETKVAAHCC